MRNGQSSVPTVSGGTQDGQLPQRDWLGTFPYFPVDHTSLLGGLMYTEAGGTSAHPTMPFRSQSRPWSSPTQNRAPPLSPDLSPQDWEDRESWCSMLDAPGPLKHYWGWTPHWQYKKEYLVRGYKTCIPRSLHWSKASLSWPAPRGGKSGPPLTFYFPAWLRLTDEEQVCTYKAPSVIIWWSNLHFCQLTTSIFLLCGENIEVLLSQQIPSI